MRKLLFILLLFPFICKSQTQILGVEKGAVNTDTIVYTGKTNVFIGDSYFAGNFYNGSSITIPAGFATETSSTATNLGISGQVLENGSVCGGRTIFDKTTIPSYVAGTHGFLVLALGTNDNGVNNGTFTPSGYQAAWEDAIDYAVATKGWPPLRIIVMTAYYTTQAGRDLYIGDCGTVTAANSARLIAYVNAGIAAAAAKGTQINNIYQSQVDTGNPDALMSGDGIHPNVTGAHFITYKLAIPYYL